MRFDARSRRTLRRLRRRLAGEEGISLTEMVVVVAILGTIIGGLSQLFVSASKSQVDQTNRVRAQLAGRVALDKLRREIHCASSVSPNPNGTWPTRSITIVIPSSCATYSSTIASVTWCTVGASAPYTLWRYPHTSNLSTQTYANACLNTGSGATSWTSNVTTTSSVTGGQIFRSYTASSGSTLASIAVDIPNKQGNTIFDVTDNIALRNTPR
jgi:type II secretory pathway pseudopilin PulG